MVFVIVNTRFCTDSMSSFWVWSEKFKGGELGVILGA